VRQKASELEVIRTAAHADGRDLDSPVITPERSDTNEPSKNAMVSPTQPTLPSSLQPTQVVNMPEVAPTQLINAPDILMSDSPARSGDSPPQNGSLLQPTQLVNHTYISPSAKVEILAPTQILSAPELLPTLETTLPAVEPTLVVPFDQSDAHDRSYDLLEPTLLVDEELPLETTRDDSGELLNERNDVRTVSDHNEPVSMIASPEPPAGITASNETYWAQETQMIDLPDVDEALASQEDILSDISPHRKMIPTTPVLPASFSSKGKSKKTVTFDSKHSPSGYESDTTDNGGTTSPIAAIHKDSEVRNLSDARASEPEKSEASSPVRRAEKPESDTDIHEENAPAVPPKPLNVGEQIVKSCEAQAPALLQPSKSLLDNDSDSEEDLLQTRRPGRRAAVAAKEKMQAVRSAELVPLEADEADVSGNQGTGKPKIANAQTPDKSTSTWEFGLDSQSDTKANEPSESVAPHANPMLIETVSRVKKTPKATYK
jgi:hypothetical protein